MNHHLFYYTKAVCFKCIHDAAFILNLELELYLLTLRRIKE